MTPQDPRCQMPQLVEGSSSKRRIALIIRQGLHLEARFHRHVQHLLRGSSGSWRAPASIHSSVQWSS